MRPASITLHQLIADATGRYPAHTAVLMPDGAGITYRELMALGGRVRDRLAVLGVTPGDRVGIYLHKSIDSVAAILGILQTGAAYVPVDPHGPKARNAFIFSDCNISALITEYPMATDIRDEIETIKAAPPMIVIENSGSGAGLTRALDALDKSAPASPAEIVQPPWSELAYILYTSGSTGKPKGVMLSHQNAVTFVDWCSETFNPNADERFSSHAPFHFDLSILDIYVPLKHGATLCIIGEDLGKDPLKLTQFMADQRITSWYSTPSVLTLMTQYGKMERHDYSAMRRVLFAGEVFPVKHLHALKAILPAPEYHNLYGPTETNVCTFYQLPDQLDTARTQPYPIGVTCSHLKSRVVSPTGEDVETGEEGELCISGPGVMQGYWNLPERSAAAFLESDDREHWYKTGDVVFEDANGDFIFVGRRDRMVKKRGYRVELGEIEAGLYGHPAVEEAAVIATQDDDGAVSVHAFIRPLGGERPSLIAMKRFCSENLLAYMIPDRFTFVETMPKTSTDKIDYQRLPALIG